MAAEVLHNNLYLTYFLMNILKSILLILLFGAIFCTANAQAPATPTSLRVHLKVDPSVSRTLTEVPPDSISHILTTLPMQCTYIVQLTDTVGIDSIQVKLGTTDGGNELAEERFAYDGSNVPTGMTYTRTGNLVQLKLGNFTGVSSFFGEARLVSALNQVSGAAKYSRP